MNVDRRLPSCIIPRGAGGVLDDAAVARLSQLIALPTVANAAAPHHVGAPAAFDAALELLEREYADVWTALHVEPVRRMRGSSRS